MKKILLVVMLAIFVVFSGCSSGEGNAKESSFNLKGTFNGGNDALKLSFTDGQPPAKIRDGGLQPFMVRVMVKNHGEFDIVQGNVVLSGISYEDFGITREDASRPLPEIRGFKKQGTNVIPGGEFPIMFSNLKYVPQLPSGIHDQRIALDICYPYQTKSLASLCISGNTLKSFDSKLKICDLEGSRNFANSGAPVQIENVRQSPGGQSSIQLQFDIVHKGTSTNGRIYRQGSFDNFCKIEGNDVASNEAALSENYVKYTVDAGNLNVKCGSMQGNSEEVLLSQKRITTFCTIDTTGEEDYERPISIILDYDYFDRVTKNLQIEHISR